MKYYPHILHAASLSLLVLLTSCNETENQPSGNSQRELTFAPSIDEMNQADTRASANTFFNTNDEFNITIQSSQAGATPEYLTYVYDADGILRGNPGYRFPLDDSYIQTIQAVWPTEATDEGIFVSDQRELDDYRKANWLVAEASATGVMATDIPVPLHFEHKNCLLEFELVGQNAYGLEITELLIELEVGGEPIACYAYTKNDNGRASYLLPPGTKLKSQEGELIGTIPGAMGDTYTIILSEIDLTLEAGKRYLVTLVPQGYNMEIYLYIGGWIEGTGEREDGIGVPFHLPDAGENGDYIIQTPPQLFSFSHVVRHYTDGSTIQWPGLTYTLSDNFTMTAEYAAMYIPIPRSLFTGTVIYQGQPVTSIPYGNGQELELFSNE